MIGSVGNENELEVGIVYGLDSWLSKPPRSSCGTAENVYDHGKTFTSFTYLDLPVTSSGTGCSSVNQRIVRHSVDARCGYISSVRRCGAGIKH